MKWLLPLVGSLVFGQTSASGIFGVNLLTNPSAEAEVNGRMIPGWGPIQDGFTVDEYGHISEEWDWDLTGCAGCGRQYFRLAWDGSDGQRSFSQFVNLSKAGTAVDAGKVSAKLWGYLGAMRDSDTSCRLTALLKDADGKDLGKIETSPVNVSKLPKPQKGAASLMLMEATGTLPPGTRNVEVRFTAFRAGDSGQYVAFADFLAFVLSQNN
jgi:hypothetical protein